jgi:uncharacterized repeat protein (TIGR03803 family)
MKTYIIHRFLVPTLIAALNLLVVGQAPAQTFTSLGNFHGSSDSPTNLGNTLYASLHGLVLSGNTFYGTAPGDDETGDSGAVYAVGADGTGLTNVYSFSYVVAPGYGPRVNADGAHPEAGLILSGTNLYGTASIGGSWGAGTVFAVSTNGMGFRVLHHFTGGSDGANPQAALILSGNTLYGTTPTSLFAIHTDGTGFTVLTNRGSYAGLLLSSNTLYGTSFYGGSWGAGTVFALSTNGTGFTVLHNFRAAPFGNSDGANPRAGLILLGNTLYGTAEYGGTSGDGTVFAIHTDGTGFANLYSFTVTYPFDIAPFVTVYTNTDGALPQAGLTLSGNTFYGTTTLGGSWGTGTLFSLSFAPKLTLTRSGTNVILSWPTSVPGFDYTGYILQSAPAITGPFTNLPGMTSPYTNPIAGAQFFRLKK